MNNDDNYRSSQKQPVLTPTYHHEHQQPHQTVANQGYQRQQQQFRPSPQHFHTEPNQYQASRQLSSETDPIMPAQYQTFQPANNHQYHGGEYNVYPSQNNGQQQPQNAQHFKNSGSSNIHQSNQPPSPTGPPHQRPPPPGMAAPESKTQNNRIRHHNNHYDQGQTHGHPQAGPTESPRGASAYNQQIQGHFQQHDRRSNHGQVPYHKSQGHNMGQNEGQVHQGPNQQRPLHQSQGAPHHGKDQQAGPHPGQNLVQHQPPNQLNHAAPNNLHPTQQHGQQHPPGQHQYQQNSTSLTHNQSYPSVLDNPLNNTKISQQRPIQNFGQQLQNQSQHQQNQPPYQHNLQQSRYQNSNMYNSSNYQNTPHPYQDNHQLNKHMSHHSNQRQNHGHGNQIPLQQPKQASQSPYHIPLAQQHNRQSLFTDVDDLIENFDADLHIANSEPVNLDECVGPIYGKCKWFNVIKGFGFITPNIPLPPPDGKNCKDIFVYQNCIKMPGFRSLREGETVECYVKKSHLGWEGVQITGPEGLDCEGTERFKKKKPDRCYNCGDLGHHAKECKFPPLPKRCHFCKAENHLVADCPFKGYNPINYPAGGPEMAGTQEPLPNAKGYGQNFAQSQGFSQNYGSGGQQWPSLNSQPPGLKNNPYNNSQIAPASLNKPSGDSGSGTLQFQKRNGLFDDKTSRDEGIARMRFHSSGIIPGKNGTSLFSPPNEYNASLPQSNNSNAGRMPPPIGSQTPIGSYKQSDSGVGSGQPIGLNQSSPQSQPLQQSSGSATYHSNFQGQDFDNKEKKIQRLSSSSPSALFPNNPQKDSSGPSIFTGENARKLWQNNSPQPSTDKLNSIFGNRVGPTAHVTSGITEAKNSENNKAPLSSIFSDQFPGSWNK